MSENKKVIPFFEKYLLTVYEASRYFNIGERKLYQIVVEHAGCEWMLYNGNRIMIKKDRFAKWLDKQSTI